MLHEATSVLPKGEKGYLEWGKIEHLKPHIPQHCTIKVHLAAQIDKIPRPFKLIQSTIAWLVDHIIVIARSNHLFS